MVNWSDELVIDGCCCWVLGQSPLSLRIVFVNVPKGLQLCFYLILLCCLPYVLTHVIMLIYHIFFAINWVEHYLCWMIEEWSLLPIQRRCRCSNFAQSQNIGRVAVLCSTDWINLISFFECKSTSRFSFACEILFQFNQEETPVDCNRPSKNRE